MIENPEIYKNGGRSAMLQIFPRGRTAMKEGRSAMLQTFPLGVCNVADLPGGMSAMLQIFWGKVADLPGGLQYNTGTEEKTTNLFAFNTSWSGFKVR